MICVRCGKWAGAHATLPGQSRDDLCMCQPVEQRKALTREQIDTMWKAPMSADWEHREFARAIEAVHGITGDMNWTPASSALPSSGKKVLATYLNALGNRRTIIAKWVAAKTVEVNTMYCDDFGEYDEDADCCWCPEGWYEQIDNWDELTAVFVEHEVTHWMPLPAAPGDEEAT